MYTRLLFASLVCLLFSTCQTPDVPIPATETLYIFPYQSQVDASNINCGYKAYEWGGDQLKGFIRNRSTEISTEELMALGQEIHNTHLPFPVIAHERAIWLEDIVDAMKPHLVKNDFPHYTYVVDAPFLNAFTIPGGNIYITSELLDAVQNKHELAYIIGHELGHNENEHTKELALLNRFIERDDIDIWKRVALKVGSGICNKSDELECDIASIYLLEKAGYDPELALGGIDLLRHLSKAPEDVVERVLLGFFSTHPWSDERDECVRAYVKDNKVTVGCAKIYQSTGIINAKYSSLDLYRYPLKREDLRLQQLSPNESVHVVCTGVHQLYQSNEWLYVQYQNSEGTFLGWVNKRGVDIVE